MQQVATGGVSRLINALVGSIGQFRPLGTAPESLAGIQLWGGGGQPACLDPQGGGEHPTGLRRMGRAAINKEHDVPAPPGLAQLAQEGLVGGRRPRLSNQLMSWISGLSTAHASGDKP